MKRPLRWQQGFNQEGTVGPSYQGHIKNCIVIKTGEEKEIKDKVLCEYSIQYLSG